METTDTVIDEGLYSRQLSFFLREGDISKSRAEVTVPRLSELNAYVPVRNLGGKAGHEITVELVRGFQVIPMHFLCNIPNSADISIFNDFGPTFTCGDPTGEQPLTGIISSIDEKRHSLQDGDFVTFAEVQGMTELNGSGPYKVSVKGPYTFEIGDAWTLASFGVYRSGGIYTQVKMPKIIHFFQSQHKRLPRPRNNADAITVVSMARKLNPDIDERAVTELAYQATGDIAPMIAVIGGFVAQEVLKACSAKFHPMVQHMYFDSLESLPTNPPSEAECQPSGSGYDAQIAVFGRTFHDKIANHRQFLVGSDAIGCEMLKNWSMIGLASGPNGAIQVTDLDTIEKSNLNDLGKFKAEVAAIAATKMSPDLPGKITGRLDPVREATEDIYNNEFFAAIDVVTNALNNVKARLYMDYRCIWYEKPLLESGTLGTKGNVQVILPHATESHGSSRDPEEAQIPHCALRSFPNSIEHTIEWSCVKFDYFITPAALVNAYLPEPDFIERGCKNAMATDQIKKILAHLTADRPSTFKDCIVWARLQFEDMFSNEIKQLLHSFPKDAKINTGQPFWSEPKRAPDPLVFGPEDDVETVPIMQCSRP
ncbi:hypothetical protein DFH09DRAFT_1266847 [Mycena vulgaris]|nr:hypothetical protein DFH09DRAFT_1266847 [Mycena vulgaris]